MPGKTKNPLYQDYDILFIDETSVQLNYKFKYGWGLKGKKISAATSPKSRNYSVIAALSTTKVLGCQVIREE